MNKNSWKIKRLGEISELQSGNGFPVEFQGKTEGDYPFAKVGDISNIARSGYHLISDANHWIDKDVIRKIKARVFPEGSIVFAKIGEAIKQNFRVISSCPMLFDNNVMGIKPNNCIIDTEYLFFYLKQVDFYGLSEKTTVPSIRKSKIETLEIPLPSLEEQKRIAAILDKADQVRRKRQEAIRLTEELGRSIFLDMFGDPVTNPKGWEEISLGKISKVQGGLQITPKRKVNNLEVPYLRVANVYRDKLNLEEIKLISVTEQELTRTALEKGDLLIVEGHGNNQEIGRSSVWDGSIANCVHQNHLIRVRVDSDKADPYYVSNFLNSAGGRRQLTKCSKTTSGLNTISSSNVKAIQILLPPIEKQKKYIELQTKILAGYKKLSLHSSDSENLFNSLLQRAFRGEL